MNAWRRFLARRLARAAIVPAPAAALACAAALGGCALPPLQVGPPDLDATSAAAPICRTPVYPPGARARSDTGTSVLTAQVDAEGRVRAASLKASAGNDDLDLAALQTVRGFCHFRPAPVPAGAATRPVEVLVAWELVAAPTYTLDLPIVRIGVRRPPGAMPPAPAASVPDDAAGFSTPR